MSRPRALLARLRARQELLVALIVAALSIAVGVGAAVYAAHHGHLDLGVPTQPTYPPTTKGAP